MPEESREDVCTGRRAFVLPLMTGTPLTGGHGSFDVINMLAATGPGGLSAGLTGNRSAHDVASFFRRE